MMRLLPLTITTYVFFVFGAAETSALTLLAGKPSAAEELLYPKPNQNGVVKIFKQEHGYPIVRCSSNLGFNQNLLQPLGQLILNFYNTEILGHGALDKDQ